MSKKLKNQVVAQSSKSVEEFRLSFQHLSAMLLTMSARVAEDTDFTLTEVLVSEHLRLYGPLTPKEVGERVGLSSGAVTRLLDRLEARGFAERGAHPDDRRKVLMRYVEQEPDTIRRPLTVYDKLNEAAERFDEGEKRTLTRFMDMMTRAIKESVYADTEKR